MRSHVLAFLATITFLPMRAQVAVQLETVVSGMTGPVDIVNCGDDRLFIVEKGGTIRILKKGVLLPTPFLNMSTLVNPGGGELGLLGVAFHPNYAQNGFFYTYYCTGTGNGSTRISRFTVSGNPDVANLASAVTIWDLAQPYANHKGGNIAFGPDGYLYFAPGDGGDGGDPGNRAQNMALGHGKMHRIDVNGGTPYAIPPTNPFASANNVDTLRTIWASGLRNPYRFTFDPANGDLWIGDVGQSVREEVDRVPAGVNTGPNFGWRCYEGNMGYNTAGCGSPGSYAPPVIDHDHSGGWCSIIAGRVYRGTRYPNLVGRFLYTDYCHGRIHSLRPQGGGYVQDTLAQTGVFGLSGFGTDVLGEMYMCNVESGVVSRVIDPSAVVRVSPKMWLEGPYDTNTGLMSDALRLAGLIPTTEPYTSLGFQQVATGGGETLGSNVLQTTGNNAVVDWVRVELRPVARPSIIAATRQGLLQRDGDVVSADNSTALKFAVGPGSYYVVVRHRNHLGVMTASPYALTATTQSIDLRSSSTATYGTNARKTVGATRVCWAGNITRDDRLLYTGANNDRDPILSRVGGTDPNATTTGYFLEDMNLDGVVKYTGSVNDRDPILVNIGGVDPNATRVEQLP